MRIIIVDIYFTKCICHSAASSVIALVLLVTVGGRYYPSFRLRLFLRLRSSVQLLSCAWLFATPWTAACQASLSSPAPGACSNSCPSSRWCYPTILPSVVPFSSCPQSFRASGSFPLNWLFTSGGQSSILYSLIDGHLGGFYFITVLSNAAINTHVCIEITNHCVV